MAREGRVSTIEVRLRLFGAFRRCAAEEVSVQVPRGSRIGAVRGRVAAELRRRWPAFAEEGLLEASVIADEHRVLDDGDLLESAGGPVSLAILPPVCGG